MLFINFVLLFMNHKKRGFVVYWRIKRIDTNETPLAFALLYSAKFVVPDFFFFVSFAFVNRIERIVNMQFRWHNVQSIQFNME